MSKAIYTGISNKARKVPKLYVGVDGKARKVKKGYVGVNGVARLFYSPVTRPPILPEPYIELEYIYTPTMKDNNTTNDTYILNTPYIDTLYYPKYDTTISLQAQIENYSGGNRILHSAIFYARDATPGNQKLILDIKSNKLTNEFYFQSGTSTTKLLIAKDIFTPFEITVKGTGYVNINGSEYNVTRIDGSINGRLTLGPYDGTNIKQYYHTVKYFRCKIYTGDRLMMDLVPCKNSAGLVGMYDLVTNAFFSSRSNVAFLPGPTVY